jgi:DnaD/phage-associated family protein
MPPSDAHPGVRRRWVKLWTQQTIFGTTSRELEPAERWVWIGLLCLAGDSPLPGTVCIAPGVPHTTTQLAQLLRVPPKLLRDAMLKMTAHDKITTNHDGIHISKWEHYQADYVRQQTRRTNLWDKYQTKDSAVPVDMRLLVIQRDNLICQHCGKKGSMVDSELGIVVDIDDDSPFELDHILPVARGGTHTPENLVLPPRVTDVTSEARVTDVTPPPEEEEEEEEDQRKRSAAAAADARAGSTCSVDPTKLAAFVAAYENNIGTLNPIVAEELETLAANYPTEWFERAVKEAVTYNRKSLRYIVVILERWERDGLPAADTRAATRAPGRRPKPTLPAASQLKQGWGADEST